MKLAYCLILSLTLVACSKSSSSKDDQPTEKNAQGHHQSGHQTGQDGSTAGPGRTLVGSCFKFDTIAICEEYVIFNEGVTNQATSLQAIQEQCNESNNTLTQGKLWSNEACPLRRNYASMEYMAAGGCATHVLDPVGVEYSQYYYNTSIDQTKTSCGALNGTYRPRGSGVNSPQPQDQSGTLIAACGDAFTYNDDKTRCISLGKKLNGDATGLVQACSQVFTFFDDKLSCIDSSTHISVSAVATVNACHKAFSYFDDRKQCIGAVPNTLYDPALAIEACSKAFTYFDDKQSCIAEIKNYISDPTTTIQQCAQTFTYTKDILNCVKN